MKKSLLACFVSTAFFAAVSLFAAGPDAKEVTLVGMGKCAKCSLHQADSCQNTVTVNEGGKEEVYFLTENDVSQDFHDNICKKPHEIKVTGVVKESGGKKEIVASKIELVKKS